MVLVRTIIKHCEPVSEENLRTSSEGEQENPAARLEKKIPLFKTGVQASRFTTVQEISYEPFTGMSSTISSNTKYRQGTMRRMMEVAKMMPNPREMAMGMR